MTSIGGDFLSRRARFTKKHTRNAHCINFTQRRCRVRRPNTIMAHFGRLSTRENDAAESYEITVRETRDERCALDFITPFFDYRRARRSPGHLSRVLATNNHSRSLSSADWRRITNREDRPCPSVAEVRVDGGAIFGSSAVTSPQKPINQVLDLINNVVIKSNASH